MLTLDKTTISKITTQSHMDEFVAGLDIKSDTVIIKPNWVDCHPGTFTEARILDLFLTSLKGKKIYLIESYTFWRSQKDHNGEGDYFSSKEATIETGKIHWDHFKSQDGWFLRFTGIDEVLKKHQAEYINVTNEIWSDRIAPKDQIKSLVESQYPTLENQELYGLVPQEILDLSGSDYISFAKLKGDAEYGATLSIKNTFGLIPDPHRLKKYHGDNEEFIKKNILDINKIYQSLFNCHFVVESVYSASYVDWSGKGLTTFTGFGIIIGGNDAFQVDSYSLKLMNRQMLGPLSSLLTDYQQIFGGQESSQDIPGDLLIDFPKV